jgi:hypothetical protein
MHCRLNPAQIATDRAVCENGPTTLRGEIRRAGETTRRLRESIRRRLRWSAAVMLLGTFAATWLLSLVQVDITFWALGLFAVLATFLGMLIFLGALVGQGIAPPLHRNGEQRRLRDRLSALPESERVGVVRPLLQDADPDTRKIAARLLRGVRLPTELSPASAPAGRGDEISSVG